MIFMRDGRVGEGRVSRYHEGRERYKMELFAKGTLERAEAGYIHYSYMDIFINLSV